MTAAAFVDRPDPFTGEMHRWYRTGDIVRWRATGELEYVGRHDSQVKLRGVRIELGDVEASIATHASVQSAAVAVRGEQLVAWVVASGVPPTVAELRRHCADLLPASMVPATFVVLDELPRTENGKLDRDRLPHPGTTAQRSSREPSTPTEIALAEMWRELFGAEAVKVDEEFFELGGHSLLAISLFATIEERFAKSLPLQQIFETPTIASLAAVLDDARPVTGAVVQLQDGDCEQPALFLVPGIDGSPLIFHRLIGLLDVPGAVYGVEIPSQRGRTKVLTMEEIAALLISDVRSVSTAQPVVLAGFSFGGKLAFEMARQLALQGCPCRLIVVDSDAPSVPMSYWRSVRTFARSAPRRLRLRARAAPLAPLRWWRRRRRSNGGAAGGEALLRQERRRRQRAKRNYVPQGYAHDLVLLTSAASIASIGDSTLWWRLHVSGSISVRSISGTHVQLMKQRAQSEIAAILSDLMADWSTQQ